MVFARDCNAYQQIFMKQPGEKMPCSPTAPQGGSFIKNTLSGKCIDVSGAPGTANGSQLLLWDCESSGLNRDNGSPTDQKWTLTGDGFIKNTLSGKCIDVSGAPGTANGSQLLLWDCESSGLNRDNGSPTDQKWTLTGDGFIKNTLSGKWGERNFGWDLLSVVSKNYQFSLLPPLL
ncbi:MAG: ricin-type beta-trefoil lectin domain protein, partial [Symploca sp. SIO3E6]|nr:ricin-type beta-trefoil lectin domain protein [Caldora sp. SIO3E6]